MKLLETRKYRGKAIKGLDLRDIDWSGGFDAVRARYGWSHSKLNIISRLYHANHTQAHMGPGYVIDWNRVDWHRTDFDLASSLNVTEYLVHTKRQRHDPVRNRMCFDSIAKVTEPRFYAWLHDQRTVPTKPLQQVLRPEQQKQSAQEPAPALAAESSKPPTKRRQRAPRRSRLGNFISALKGLLR